MKPWLKILILVLALAAVVGACLLVVHLVNREPGEDPSHTDAAQTLAAYPGDLTWFSYTYQGTETRFELVNYNWVNASDRDMPLRQEALDEVAKLIKSGAVSVRLVDDTGELVSSETFGLAEPVLTVRASDGQTARTLYVGDLNKSFDAYYARVDGSDEVHLIDRAIPDALEKDVFALALDAPAYPGYKAEDIVRIRLFDGEARREMTYSEGGSKELYSDYYTWFEQTADGGYAALSTKAVNSLCEALAGLGDLPCAAYASSPEALERFGLSGEKRGFDVTYRGEIDVETEAGVETQEAELTLEVLAGAPDADGNCAVTWTGNDMIYLAPSEKIDAILSGLTADLSPDEVCAIPLESVESFLVTYGGEEINIVRSQREIMGSDGQKTMANVFTSNERVVDSTNVMTFYDGLLALTVEGRAEEAPVGETPIMTVVFRRNTETFREMTLNVYEYSVNFYRISFNGDETALVSIRDIDRMGEAILKTLKN